jgi:phosphohistidine phosphatase
MTGTRVYLVRHAKAEKDHPRGDAARRLTGDGRESFALLVRELGSALTLRRILSSPFARAVETARVLSEVTGAEIEEEAALSSGRSSGKELLELALASGDGVALVGHNPEMEEAIARASGREEAVRPGSVAAVELGARGAARLLWIAAPGRAGG